MTIWKHGDVDHNAETLHFNDTVTFWIARVTPACGLFQAMVWHTREVKVFNSMETAKLWCELRVVDARTYYEDVWAYDD